ncbi:MAG: hypothetical protein H7246_14350, partial [Phycisphaerae bacterium]|nr:hypothetical protein [Saprospiraceae bacterium]
MSDLHKLWKEINEQSVPQDQGLLREDGKFLPTSRNVLTAIRTRNRWKVYLLFVYLVGCVTMYFFLNRNWESYAILSTMFLFGLVNLWLVLPYYQAIKKQDLLMSGSAIEVLEFYY